MAEENYEAAMTEARDVIKKQAAELGRLRALDKERVFTLKTYRQAVDLAVAAMERTANALIEVNDESGMSLLSPWGRFRLAKELVDSVEYCSFARDTGEEEEGKPEAGEDEGEEAEPEESVDSPESAGD